MISRVKYSTLLTILKLILVDNVESSGVPVLLLETLDWSSTSVPAFSYLTTDDFATRLIKKVHTHRPTILVFAEETLSLEDFSWKDETQKGAFPSLKNISESSKIEFIPSVQNPLAALNDLVQSQNYIFRKYDQSSASAKPGTIIEVTLPEPTVSEDRPQLLRRHDALISQIYSSLVSSSTHLIVLFTGRQNSWVEAEHNRIRRQATDNSTDEMEEKAKVLARSGQNSSSSNETNFITVGLSFPFRGSDILMDSTNSPILDFQGEKINLTGRPEIQSEIQETVSSVTVIYVLNSTGVTIRFLFSVDGIHWGLTEAELIDYGNTSTTIVLKPSTNIVNIPLGESFKTNKEFTFGNADEGVNLTFTDLQAQKFSTSGDWDTFSPPHIFGAEGYYFTSVIWMGIFVFWIMSIILSWGITMLLDIKTNDRFDDPKGRNVSILGAAD